MPFWDKTGGIGWSGRSAATIVKFDELGPLPKMFHDMILKV